MKSIVSIFSLLIVLTVAVDANADGFVNILSVDHADGKAGQYFNFNNAEVDKIMCNQTWGNKQVAVRDNTTGKVSKAILWRKPNGGSAGDGHGRWDDGTASGNQWRAGSSFTILNTTSVKILSANHSSGAPGQYFNFNNSDVDKVLGRTNWNDQTFLVQDNKRRGVRAVKLWRKVNGGAVGDGHGRFVNNPSPNQWAVGDVFTIVPAKAIQVKSVDHATGTRGQYFNFYISEVDAILNGNSWGGKKMNIMDGKTGRTSTGVLWRKSNGGSNGDGHGRWDDGSAGKNLWKTGDVFFILK